jgi:hypothetical protein
MGEAEEYELRIRLVDRNTIETIPPPIGDDIKIDQSMKFVRRPF